MHFYNNNQKLVCSKPVVRKQPCFIAKTLREGLKNWNYLLPKTNFSVQGRFWSKKPHRGDTGSHNVCEFQCSAVQCSAVQCSAVQCSAVQFIDVQCNAVRCSAVLCSAVQDSAVQLSAVQCSSVQCSSVQRSAPQCSTVQHSTVQCNSLKCSAGQFIEYSLHVGAVQSSAQNAVQVSTVGFSV